MEYIVNVGKTEQKKHNRYWIVRLLEIKEWKTFESYPTLCWHSFHEKQTSPIFLLYTGPANSPQSIQKNNTKIVCTLIRNLSP